MFKKPDPTWRTVFSTEWILDEESPAFDVFRVYAYGLRELKLFRNKPHARLALIEVEKNLRQTQSLRLRVAAMVSLTFGAMLLVVGGLLNQYLSGIDVLIYGLGPVIWVFGGWIVFCMVIRGAVAFELRKKLVTMRTLCGVCGYDLRFADHPVCPECGASITNSMPGE